MNAREKRDLLSKLVGGTAGERRGALKCMRSMKTIVIEEWVLDDEVVGVWGSGAETGRNMMVLRERETGRHKFRHPTVKDEWSYEPFPDFDYTGEAIYETYLADQITRVSWNRGNWIS